MQSGRRSARTLVGVSCLVSLVILMIGAAFALDGSRRQTPPVERRNSRLSPSVVSRSPVSLSAGTNGERDAATGSSCSQRAHSNARGTRGNDSTPHVNQGDRGNQGSGCSAQGDGHRAQGGAKGDTAHRHQGTADHTGAQGSGGSSKPQNAPGHANGQSRDRRDSAGTHTHGSAAW